jgi:hypothetical protein
MKSPMTGINFMEFRTADFLQLMHAKMLVTMTLGMSPIGGDGANRTASHMTLFIPIMR